MQPKGRVVKRSMRESSGGQAPHAILSLALALVITLLLTAPVASTPLAEAGPDIWDHTGRPVVFEGFGTPDPSLRIILYEWDFDGDGVFEWNSTRTGSATHVYETVGDYTATLRVTQYNASKDEVLTASDTTRVTIVSGKPVGRITSSATAQVDIPHRLRAEYYDPDGGQLTFEWRIEGELVSNDASFKHRFEEIRVYNITLVVRDDEGEAVERQVNLKVLEELEEEADLTIYYAAIIIVILLVAVAGLAYRSILKAPKDRAGRRRRTKATYAELGQEAPEIVTQATLADRQADPERSTRPKVVRPERATGPPTKEKGPPSDVPAAPERLPCPECGTDLTEEGTCPFCDANDSIDSIERRLRELQEDGFIIAEAEDRLDLAKTELHVKNFEGVTGALEEARQLMDVAVRDHDRCLTLITLVEDLISEAKDRDLDATKAVNLFKLSQSFMKSGKYPKAIHYAERSRDFLLDILEPFDLDRYFCTHCKAEVAEEDEECPNCSRPLESGIIKRVKKELALLRQRFEGLSRDALERDSIASQIEKASEHVERRSAAAAKEHLQNARRMLDEVEASTGGADADADGPTEGRKDEV